MRPYRILLSPEAAEGTISTATDADKGKGPDLAALVDKLVSKHGSAVDAVRVLANENYTYRDQIRDLKARVPVDGTVVLSGDDAAAWGAYRNLGKPEDVRKAIRDRDEFAGELSGFKRRDALAEIGEKAGVTNLKAFSRIAGDAEFEVKAEKRDGKDIEVVYVKDGDSAKPFDAYFADFLPSIKPDAAKATPAGPFGTPKRNPPATRDDGAAPSDLHREVAARRASGNYTI